MKIWVYRAEINWCADHEVEVLVKANTQRKAILKAEEHLKKSYFAVKFISCNEADKTIKKTPYCPCSNTYCDEQDFSMCGNCLFAHIVK